MNEVQARGGKVIVGGVNINFAVLKEKLFYRNLEIELLDRTLYFRLQKYPHDPWTLVLSMENVDFPVVAKIARSLKLKKQRRTKTQTLQRWFTTRWV